MSILLCYKHVCEDTMDSCDVLNGQNEQSSPTAILSDDGIHFTEMKYDIDISIHTFQNNLRTFIF